MGDGPPSFRRGFSCPAVLRIHTRVIRHVDYRAITFFGWLFQADSSIPMPRDGVSYNPKRLALGLGWSRFARHYSGNRVCFLFLWVLRCFSSPGVPFIPYEFRYEYDPFRVAGCPIRKSPGQSLLTAYRSISVFVPSFIGS